VCRRRGVCDTLGTPAPEFSCPDGNDICCFIL
jgi:hypothetical protein